MVSTVIHKFLGFTLLGSTSPRKKLSKKELQLAPSCTINSIAHFTCHRDLGFHQFIFIHLPQTDAGALETSSNTVAFVSLPKTSSSMLYDLFFSATPRAPTLIRNTQHTKHTTHISFHLPFSLLSFYHSVYLHIASISMPHNGLKHSTLISFTDVDCYVHFSDSSVSKQWTTDWGTCCRINWAQAIIGFQSHVISFGFNLTLPAALHPSQINYHKEKIHRYS